MRRPDGRQGGTSALSAPHGGEAWAAAALREFREQGFVAVPAVLPANQADELRDLVERRYQDPATHWRTDLDLIRGGVSLMRIFEYHRAFRDLLTLQPVLHLVERLLGSDCHVVAQNALRTPHGKGIVNWHIDDAVFLPFLADLPPIAVNPDRIPCYSLNVLVLLGDVEQEHLGPTQVVAGSHLSGRRPAHAPSLPAGVIPRSLVGRAGDAFMVNSQTWHRGAQNESERTRYLVTTTYGRRFISQRFYPFLNYEMPSHVLHNATERTLRLLGKHDKGPYG